METSLRETYQSVRLSRRANHRDQPNGCVINRFVRLPYLLVGILIVFSIGAMSSDCSAMQEPPHDYMADINAKARSVPEDERAWPLYREALVVLYRDMRELGDEFYIDKPGGEVWDQTVEFIEAHQKEIALIRQAATMPGLGFVVGHTIAEEDKGIWPDAYANDLDSPKSLMDLSLLNIRLPYLSGMRLMTKMLAADAHLGMKVDDSDRVLSDIQAMLGSAKHSRETPILICDLVSVASFAMSFQKLTEILQIHPALLDDEQMRFLLRELPSLTNGEESLLQARYEGERYMILDVIQRIYIEAEKLTPDGKRTFLDVLGYTDEKSSGDDPWPIWLDPDSAYSFANRQEMEDECNRLVDMAVEESEVVLWKRSDYTVSDEIGTLSSSSLWKTKYLPLCIMLPSFSRSYMTQERILMERDAILTAIALELYRREHEGLYPPNLKVLVPKYLPTIPLDRFNGKPMGYLVQDDGSVILYCVGVDLDDDGGRESDPKIKVENRVTEWLHPSKVAEYKEEDQQIDTPGAKRKLADGDFLLWESHGDTLDGPS